jgi:N-acetylglucosamine-6-phosphate deacetylase
VSQESGRHDLLIHSARKVDVDGEVADFWFTARDGLITQTGHGAAWRNEEASSVVDAEGRQLTPGFLDIHGHGGGGYSFEDAPDEIEAALAMHRAHGTTRSVLSLVANPLDEMCRSLGTVAELMKTDPLILGAHAEGPYLSPRKAGAHNPAFLRTPEVAEVERLIAAGGGSLRQITIAPELPSALEAIRYVTAAGVIAAVGHTAADHDQAQAAFDAGAGLLTHTFNAMNGIHHRAPGPVIAAFGRRDVSLELVLDGIHVHPAVAGLVFANAPGRVALITDAMAAAGAAEGEYRLGSLDVTVSHGKAVLRGTDQIAGSTLTQDHALRIAIQHAGVSPRDAVTALTATPAAVLGREADLGRLAPGYAADAVLLDDDWSARAVWAAGSRLA